MAQTHVTILHVFRRTGTRPLMTSMSCCTPSNHIEGSACPATNGQVRKKNNQATCRPPFRVGIVIDNKEIKDKNVAKDDVWFRNG